MCFLSYPKPAEASASAAEPVHSGSLQLDAAEGTRDVSLAN